MGATQPRITRLIEAIAVLGALFGGRFLLATAGIGFAGPIAVVASVLLATVILHRSGESWRALGLRLPAGFGEWLRLPLLVITAMAGTVVVAAVIVPQLVGPPGGGGSFDFLRGDTLAFLFTLIFVGWGTAAIGEELLFRGFVLDRLDRFLGETRSAIVMAAIVQAAIFGLAHGYQGMAGIVMTGLIGLVMAIVYLLGKRWLLPIILAHGLIDTLSFVQIYQS